MSALEPIPKTHPTRLNQAKAAERVAQLYTADIVAPIGSALPEMVFCQGQLAAYLLNPRMLASKEHLENLANMLERLTALCAGLQTSVGLVIGQWLDSDAPPEMPPPAVAPPKEARELRGEA